MNKSFESLRKEHSQVTIELGKMHQKMKTLSNSIYKKGYSLTYKRAQDLTHKPVFYDGRVWYIEKVTKFSGYVSVIVWTIDRNIVQKNTNRLIFPDQSFLGGVVFEDEYEKIKTTIDTLAASSKDIVEYYAKKAKKKVEGKETKE